MASSDTANAIFVAKIFYLCFKGATSSDWELSGAVECLFPNESNLCTFNLFSWSPDESSRKEETSVVRERIVEC